MATDLQDFLATTEHRRPSRILYHAGFTSDLHRRVVDHIGTDDIAAHYGFYTSGYLSLHRPDTVPAPNYTPYWANEDLPEGTRINGLGVAEVPAHYYHFTGYVSPLRKATTLQDIENYPLDDLSLFDDSHLAGHVAELHNEGKVAIGGVGHTYESAWQIRGYEEFLVDLMDRPAWADCLLQRIADQNMIKSVAFARAGADELHCGDDIANQNTLMFAPALWRRMFLPKWAAIWAATKAINPATRIWYHSDGNISEVVPDLIAAGVDILNPLQPECTDIDDIHRRYGDHLTLDGCIGTQSTMPWGSPADVRARVKACIDKYGREGGLILSPTHVLEPEVPIENIDAMVDACREFGTFA